MNFKPQGDGFVLETCEDRNNAHCRLQIADCMAMSGQIITW